MIGYSDSSSRYEGVTVFSSSSNNYSNSNAERYVNEYVLKLKNMKENLDISGRLLYKNELDKLVNNGNILDIEFITSSADSKGYSWLYTTSYWMGTPNGTNEVWYMDTRGAISKITYTYSIGYGVRPVITINESDIK